ncbi:MAG: aspartate/tyrosine/aromatic aminotransferase [Propionibacterium sp.]|nr:aspartate/tyrosine/aromatic aminotransferase [Propionibacterium sp.]
MNLLERAELAPADPILGLTEAFVRDTRTDKVNLGVGVYLDEAGAIPLMAAVGEAERRIVAAAAPHGYVPIDGLPAFRAAVRPMVFGEDAPVLERVATVQTVAGTGALKVGADFLKQLNPSARVLISDPSWENHRALFTRAGFPVDSYRYYDAEARGIDLDGMLADLRAAVPGTVVVLHPCCHNPTGYDLSPEQWDQVVAVLAERELFPFVDMAYQGFAEGLAQDGAVVGKLVDAGVAFMVGTSYSKTFGLYGQRIGSLSVVCADADEAARVLSQLKICIRTNYSNPPAHGARIVSTILGDQGLRTMWEDELTTMRNRIASLRKLLVKGLEAQNIVDMGFIAEQRGMFSYSGLGPTQMERLREEHGIYGTNTGRMCVAALNHDNVGRVAQAIAAVRA